MPFLVFRCLAATALSPQHCIIVPAKALRFYIAGLPRPAIRYGDNGISQVSRKPLCTCHVLRPRPGLIFNSNSKYQMLLSAVLTASALTMLAISGLNSTAYTLTVYASQCGLLLPIRGEHHAKLVTTSRWTCYWVEFFLPLGFNLRFHVMLILHFLSSSTELFLSHWNFRYAHRL